MHLSCCCITHRTSTLQERERLQLQRGELPQAAETFLRVTGASEAAIVATCNRVEFYRVDEKKNYASKGVQEFYRERGIAGVGSLPDIILVRQGTSAARHLFKVAAGLDSTLLGEYQVLGQVKEAYSAACSVNCAGKLLHKLFHNAFHVAKTIHSETEIGSGATGLAGASIQALQDRFAFCFQDSRALLVGVNKSTELLLAKLRHEGAKTILANRTLYKAEKLARQSNAEPASLSELPHKLAEVDLVVTATSSNKFVITKKMLSDRKIGKPLYIIDLAIPRDVDPQVADLPEVTLLDLDDMKSSLVSVQVDRETELPYAMQMIEDQVAAFEIWRRSAFNGSGNAGLRRILDADRIAVLDRFRDSFRPGDAKALEALSRRLYRQFLRRIDRMKS